MLLKIAINKIKVLFSNYERLTNIEACMYSEIKIKWIVPFFSTKPFIEFQQLGTLAIIGHKIFQDCSQFSQLDDNI